MLTDIQPLTQQQRLEARKKAQKVIQALEGEKPKLEHFRKSTSGKYPQWITGVVVVLSLVVLLTAFLLSAMRLYHIGYRTFYETLEHDLSSTIAGFAIVVLSEAAAVLFTIALSVIGQTKTQRRILSASIAGTAALALSGNYYVALFEHKLTVFSVLESMLPPLLTLSTAYVLKELILNMIEQRHADQSTFERALMEWEHSTADPESHPKFLQAYPNELRDALLKSNRKRKAVKEAMAELTNPQWKVLVTRELQADEWFTVSDEIPEEESETTEVPLL
jgi:hypothetical protein